MLITHFFSFSRTAIATLLAATLTAGITGCSSDSSTNNIVTKKSDSYKVEYMPDAKATQGKSEFQIRVTDLASKEAVTGEMVTLMPMMYMTDKTHSTPVDGACTESATAGIYDCTVFYVMADVDSTGASTGYWELTVMVGGVGGESVIFEPSVGMAMGTTAMLRHENLAMGTMVRTFQVFKSNLAGTTGDHSFELFTSTMETMMSFPAVYPTVELNVGTLMTLTINSMSVRVSTQSDFVGDVHDATSDANGYWTATGIQGLVDGEEGTLYVEVTINGNVLNSSIDGVFIDETATPTHGTFTVTP
jgi:hypothetical protein